MRFRLSRRLRRFADIDVIDSILDKTQFIPYHPQLSESLPLVKVMLYVLLRFQFDYSGNAGIKYVAAKPDAPISDDVAVVADALRAFKTKLSAAFARIRVARRASGDSLEEQFKKILPTEARSRETAAGLYRKHRFQPHV